MFQDFEGFPRALYSESSVSDKIWEWLELDEDDRELLAVYQNEINSDGDIAEAREAFSGKYDSEKAWAEEWLDSTGFFHEIPKSIRQTVENFFDFEAYARDARIGGGMSFVNHDGEVWVFYNN